MPLPKGFIPDTDVNNSKGFILPAGFIADRSTETAQSNINSDMKLPSGFKPDISSLSLPQGFIPDTPQKQTAKQMLQEAIGSAIDPFKRAVEPMQQASVDISQGKMPSGDFIPTGVKSRAAKGVGMGITQMAGATAGTLKWVGADKLGETLSDTVKDVKKQYEVKDPKFADQVAQGFGSMATFFVPGLAITKTAQFLSVVPKLAAWFGIVASSLMESGVEAGSTYERAKEKGFNEKEAKNAATKTFLKNLPILVITNKLGGLFEGGKSAVIAAVKSGSFEGVQEGLQQLISNKAVNDPAWQGVAESLAIGGITGGGMGALTSRAVAPEITPTSPKIAPDTQIKPTVGVTPLEQGVMPTGALKEDIIKGLGNNYKGIQATKTGDVHIVEISEIKDEMWIPDEKFNQEYIEKAKNARMEMHQKAKEPFDTYSVDTQSYFLESKRLGPLSSKTSAASISSPVTGLEASPETTRTLEPGPSQETTLPSGKRKVIEPPPKDIIAEKEGDVKGEISQPSIKIPKIKSVIAEATGMKKPTKITITTDEMSLLKQKLASEARGAKFGAREARKQTQIDLVRKFSEKQADMTEVKGAINTYAQEHLDPENRGKLLNIVANAKTQNDLSKAMDYVDKMEEQFDKKDAVSNLRKNIKKINIKKLRPEYKDEIQGLIDSVDLTKHTEPYIKSLEKTREFLSENPDSIIPEKRLNQLASLDKKNIGDMTKDDVDLLNNSISHAVKLMQLKNKLIFKKKYRDLNDAVTEAVDNIKQKKEIDTDSEVISTKEQAKEAGILKRIFTTESYNAELTSEILDGKEKGIIKQVVYDGIDEGYGETLKFRQEADDYFKKELKGIDTTRWSEYFNVDPSEKNVDYVDIKLPSGKSMTMTKGERIAFYLSSKNYKNLKHLLNGGFSFKKRLFKINKMTSEDLQAVVSSMTADEIKVAEAIGNYFNAVQKSKINEVSVDLDGFEVATEDNYFPIDVNYLDRRRDPLKLTKKFSHSTLEGMGPLKERANTNNAIVIDDAFATVYKSIKQISAYYGLAKPLRNAKMVLNDKNFQTEVSKRHGSHYMDALKNYLRDVEDSSHDLSRIERLTLDLINKIDVAVLSVNPFVMLKQPISLMAATTEIDIKYFPKNIKPESTEVMSKWHPQLRDRFEGGNISREIGEVNQTGEIRNFWTHAPTVSQKLMSGIRNFDYQAIGRIWKWVENETNALHPNLKGDEKMKHIANRTWEVVRKTQPTFAMKDRSGIGRERGAFIRLLTKYSSQRNKNYMMLRRSIEKYNRGGKTVKDKAKLVKNVGIVTILMPVLLRGVDALRDWVYDRKPAKHPLKREILNAISYNLGNLYFAGNIFRSYSSKMEYGKWGGSATSGDILASSLEEGIDAAVDFSNTVDQFMSEERFKKGEKRGQLRWKSSLVDAIDNTFSFLSRFKGVPYDTVKKMVVRPFRRIKRGPRKAESQSGSNKFKF